MTLDKPPRTLVSDGREPAPPPSESAPTDHQPQYFEHAVSVPPTETVSVGDVVEGRFQVRMLSQVGGMGAVYRADDLRSGRPVALKTLHAGSSGKARFLREAERLGQISHPGIPSLISRGSLPGGSPYFVMEWLDGVDLGTYLKTRRLSLGASVRVVRLASLAIAAAHELGIVHRDLSPNNLFLVHACTENLRILDFGVARMSSESSRVTEEGSRIGTPGYMAPEQVESQVVTPQTDVFSLGCVLYELLTGLRPFAAPTIGEVFARILRETPEKPSAFNGGIPPELDEIVLACLDKNPVRRPENGHEFASLLETVQALLDDALPQPDPQTPRPFGDPAVMSVVALEEDAHTSFDRVSQVAQSLALRAVRVGEGVIVISVAGPGTISDQAGFAARVALSLQKATRARAIAIATGIGEGEGSFPVGRVVDSARAMLLGARSEGAGRGNEPAILIDENTASFIEARFDLNRSGATRQLLGLREAYDPLRVILGRKSSCVGRRRELAILEASLVEAMEDALPGVVLLTGESGIGKSRLGYEFARRARRQHSHVEVFRAVSDRAGSEQPFWPLAQVVLHAARIKPTDPDLIRRQKLHERLRSCCSEADLPRVREFLGELVGLAAAGEESPELKAARRDPQILSEQVQRALVDYLRAECGKNPVVLLLDDFHFADLPTVKYLDTLLRNLSEARLLIVALARPAVHEFFPKLWAQRSMTELRLSGLSRSASLQMVAELCPGLPPEREEAVIDRARGNPFWIEQLVRADALGQGDDTLESSLLLGQAKISDLHRDARRLLRAGSVFGNSFCLSGARALVGSDSFLRPWDTVVRDLIEAEILVEVLGGDHPERCFQFGSALLRDAAYSLLGERDRERSHAEAGFFLEKQGSEGAYRIAIHFGLGGEPDRARPLFVQAALEALAKRDFDTALSAAEEGLGLGVGGADELALNFVKAEVFLARSEPVRALRAARQILLDAEETSTEYGGALSLMGRALDAKSDRKEMLELGDRLAETIREFGANEMLRRAAFQTVGYLARMGASEAAEALFKRAEPGPEGAPQSGRTWGEREEALFWLHFERERPRVLLERLDRAAMHFDEQGQVRDWIRVRIQLGGFLNFLGVSRDATEILRDAVHRAEEQGELAMSMEARAALGAAMLPSDALEGQKLLEEAEAHWHRRRDVRRLAEVRLALAAAQLDRLEEEDAALENALYALELSDHPGATQHKALALAMRASLALGDTRQAELLFGRLSQIRLAELGLLSERCQCVVALAVYQQARGEPLLARQLLKEEVTRLEAEWTELAPREAQSFVEGSRERSLAFSLETQLERRQSFSDLSIPSPSEDSRPSERPGAESSQGDSDRNRPSHGPLSPQGLRSEAAISVSRARIWVNTKSQRRKQDPDGRQLENELALLGERYARVLGEREADTQNVLKLSSESLKAAREPEFLLGFRERARADLEQRIRELPSAFLLQWLGAQKAIRRALEHYLEQLDISLRARRIGYWSSRITILASALRLLEQGSEGRELEAFLSALEGQAGGEGPKMAPLIRAYFNRAAAHEKSGRSDDIRRWELQAWVAERQTTMALSGHAANLLVGVERELERESSFGWLRWLRLKAARMVLEEHARVALARALRSLLRRRADEHCLGRQLAPGGQGIAEARRLLQGDQRGHAASLGPGDANWAAEASEPSTGSPETARAREVS